MLRIIAVVLFAFFMTSCAAQSRAASDGAVNTRIAQPILTPINTPKPKVAQRTDSTDGVAAGSAAGTKKLGDIINGVKQFTINDLSAAAEDAENQRCDDDVSRTCPDPSGKCWRALIPYVEAQQSPLPAGLGLAQAIQKARNIQRRVQAGTPDKIKEACAIVLWDAENALLKFGLRFSPLPIKLP